MQTSPTTQAPALYRKKVGDIVVTAINDGILDGNYGLVKGIEEDAAKSIFVSNFRGDHPIFTVNCFVVHTGGKVVLIDSGAGTNAMFDGGRLPMALNAAGVSPQSVDILLLSHLHPDHAGGVATQDGRAMFPNAEMFIHEDEARFWLGGDEPPAEMKPFFDIARGAVAPYKDRLHTFAKGEVAPGIEAEPLPGHTPGHTGFHIASGKDQLLMWTDIVHLPVLQTRHPEVYVAFDADPEQAKAQRKRIFDKVASDKLMVAGSHLDFPAMGHLERAADGGYHFVTEVWRPMM